MPSINDIQSGYLPPARTILVPAATTTLTLTAAQHANSLILVQSTGGLAVTPPAATGTFNWYYFMCVTAVSGGSFTVDPKAGNASDVFGGIAFGGTTGAVAGTWVSGATTNFITFNATTTGGLMGSQIWMQDVGTNKWVGWVAQVSSGTAATCFSNH